MQNPHGKITRRDALVAIGGASTLLASGLSSTAYAQANQPAIDTAIQWAKANLPNSTPEIVSGAAKEKNLTLLMLTDANDVGMRAMIAKFREHYPFVEVSYTLQNSAQVLNRFTAEVNAKKGVTDCIMHPSNIKELNNYIASGAIAEFVVSQDAAFPEGSKERGHWYAWAGDRCVTIYRKNSLSDEERQLIRTFKGLGDPRFKGRLGINGITNSTSVTASYVLLNQPDQSLWQGLAANKPQVKPASPALLDGLLSGEYDVALFGSYASAAIPAKDGAPIEFGNTALVPTLYAPGVISALAPSPNAARLWQDWVMSKEAQDLWVSLMGVSSARTNMTAPWAKQQPWFFEDPPSHKPIDWADFAQKQAAVVERFKKDFQAG